MQPLNVDPSGLDAFASKCEGHSENVVGQTGSSPGSAPPDQLTGMVIQVLYALVTGHGAAMGRELSANGQGSSLAGLKFSENEAGSSVKLADVLGPTMSMGGQALSAGGSFAGQAMSSGMQGINTAVQGINGAVQNITKQTNALPANAIGSTGAGGGSVAGSVATTPESGRTSPYNPVAHNEESSRDGGKSVGAQGDKPSVGGIGGGAMPASSSHGRHRKIKPRTFTVVEP